MVEQTNEEFGVAFAKSLLFLAGAELQLQASADLVEAERVQHWNEPWSRFLRRRAAKKINQANLLAPGGYAEGDPSC